MNGVVFDIKELSVYDGPGVRTTVFFKGCPLRCRWCHNPEGLSYRPQIMVSASCLHCGECAVEGCDFVTSGECSGCGKCVTRCPHGFRHVAGTIFTSDALTERLARFRDWYEKDGGVTFSGGEPTAQYEFLLELLTKLRKIGINTAVQTCGFCEGERFDNIISATDFIFFDIKHPDPAEHLKWTGRSNAVILRNLDALKRSRTPFIARIPVIRGVNDSPSVMKAAASLLYGAEKLIQVELLSYNTAAGAKYSMVGLKYSPEFSQLPPEIDPSPFKAAGIKTIIRK